MNENALWWHTILRWFKIRCYYSNWLG